MINDSEITNVSKLTAFDRYEYFLKRAVDFEELWMLKSSDHEFVLSDIEDQTLITFWSNEEYVKQCLIDDWRDYYPIKYSMDEFYDLIVPIIKKHNYLVEIFPIPNKTGFIVDLDEFLRDIQEEDTNYG